MENNCKLAFNEIAKVLEKYDISSHLVLLADNKYYEGSIYGDAEKLADIVRKGASLNYISAIEVRKFINNINSIKL